MHILVSGHLRDIKFCFFGEMAVHAQAVNASAMACISPDASREGTVHLRLARTRQQPPQRMREHDVLFEYAAEPRLLGVHPTSGAACGGGMVQVRGAWFVQSSVFIRFGSTAVETSAGIARVETRFNMKRLCLLP